MSLKFYVIDGNTTNNPLFLFIYANVVLGYEYYYIKLYSHIFIYNNTIAMQVLQKYIITCRLAIINFHLIFTQL